MIAAVLDANVLASGFTSRTGAPGQLLYLWTTGAFELVTSDHILAELERTFEDRYFRQRLMAERADANIALLHREARLVQITVQLNRVASHPEDDLVLATAVSGGVSYLVTGDRALQRLESYDEIAIVSPRVFLDYLQEDTLR